MEERRGVEKKEKRQPRDASSTVPNTCLLKIDKDCHVDCDWIEDYIRLVLTVACWFHVAVNSIKTCNSRRKGLHFYIEINPPVNAQQANRLQWLLGDDCQRVDFNRARIESGLAEWSKLFERANVRLRTIYHASRFLQEHKKKRNGGEVARKKWKNTR